MATIQVRRNFNNSNNESFDVVIVDDTGQSHSRQGLATYFESLELIQSKLGFTRSSLSSAGLFGIPPKSETYSATYSTVRWEV